MKMENNKSSLLQGEEHLKEQVSSVDTKELLSLSTNSGGKGFYCDAMDETQINTVIGSEFPHLIILIGFSEFGKSTFVASLYHKAMSEGQIGGYEFFDSDTFSGFERRAYIRNVKLNPRKRFDRTTTNEGCFLTMSFSKENRTIKLIISDKSGETYKNDYTANQNSVNKDQALINGKHLIFFIDAKILVSDEDFLEFESSFNLLLKRMKSAAVFEKEKKIDIIFNKMDLIEENEKQEFERQVKVLSEKIEDISGINVNQQFFICSNKMANNEKLATVFNYIVSSCEQDDQRVLPETDWVNSYLKNKK